MGKVVLLVDDHELVRSLLRKSFESAGFVCGEAENGAHAVEQVEQLMPDLIVLDLSMPVMNGLEAAPLLKKKLPGTPIILFTMHTFEGLTQVAAAAGIAAVVSKQRTMAEVLAKAHSLLKLSCASGEL
jgi:CheY-like chemotaxis protein